MIYWDHDDDKLREECGVFGVFRHDQASAMTASGLHALQHRGQEACGIASFDEKTGFFHNERHTGLVGENFGKNLKERLPGNSAIGHNRYPTQGTPAIRNIQPIFADLDCGGFACAHNGNLTNSRALRKQLVDAGAIFQSTMDTEVILHLISRSDKARITERFVDAISQIEGGYALVALTENMMIGARDPVGLRPLILGDKSGTSVLASETCALDAVGADFVREVEPGEIVIITDQGVESLTPFRRRSSAPCLFEFVYFARPDSIIQGQSVYNVRRRMGIRLAEETPANADVIVPVPDSGNPAALGFSEASGIPFQFGIIRNHYVGRSFIQPTAGERQSSVSKKHSPNKWVLDGKSVVLVDDSIVRGTTSKRIVQMVRDAGAREIHFRSASPPIKFPDFYGIDMPSERDLLAANHSLEEMSEELGVDSLGFLSVEGLYWAVGDIQRNPNSPQYADHCFTGDYPTRLIDRRNDEGRRGDEQLSFLDD
ncbi:MAG: amidophosphoribosyltransferase [Ponticaulis sp.]|nr:amidophosphoribosyltransferase [Ponticaulis sp.]